MKRLWPWLVVGIVLAIGIVVYAKSAREAAWRKGPFFLFHGPDFLQGLRPSQKQWIKIRKVIMETDGALLPLKLEEARTKLEIGEILLLHNPDRAQISAKLQKILVIESHKQQQMVNAYFQIMKLLTPDQQEAFSHLIVRHLARGCWESGDMPVMPGGGPHGPAEMPPHAMPQVP